jgi:hypothetical protein
MPIAVPGSDVIVRFLHKAIFIAAVSLLAVASANAKTGVSDQSSDWCKKISPRLPTVNFATCQASALAPTGAVSANGFPILMRQIPAAKGDNKKAIRVLLLGGIHGDELTASAIVFRWMQWLGRPIAQEFQWHIVPLLNPDGMLAPVPKRVNAHGVDLNRNFPTPGWDQDAPRYWAKVTGKDPRRFPGPAPLSEPESRWVYEEIERFQPDVVVSVHAPFGVLDFDGPVNPPSRFGRLILNPVGVYPGSLGNYGGLHRNVPVITLELPNAQAMPSPADMQHIWADMLTWIEQHVPKRGTMAARQGAVIEKTAATVGAKPH